MMTAVIVAVAVAIAVAAAAPKALDATKATDSPTHPINEYAISAIRKAAGAPDILKQIGMHSKAV